MAERASTPKPNFAEKNLAKTHSPVVSRTHPHVSCDLDQLLHSAPGIEQGRPVWRRGRLAVDAQFGLIIGFELDHIFIGYMIAGIPFLGYFSVAVWPVGNSYDGDRPGITLSLSITAASRSASPGGIASSLLWHSC